jgi:hypothetical protein
MQARMQQLRETIQSSGNLSFEYNAKVSMISTHMLSSGDYALLGIVP